MLIKLLKAQQVLLIRWQLHPKILVSVLEGAVLLSHTVKKKAEKNPRNMAFLRLFKTQLKGQAINSMIF